MGQRRRGVDQHRPTAGVINDNEQEEAGDPRRVRLPLEPINGRRHLVFGQRLALHHFVKAARVGHPQLARDVAISLARGGGQVTVEPHEQERVTNPHDRGEHVGPTDDNVEPL